MARVLLFHRKLGAGFLESVYQEALEKQFIIDNVQYVKEQKLRIQFDEILLDKYFKADFICFDKIIVEVKAQKFVVSSDIDQVINYLTATKMNLGYLVNFGAAKLYYKRLIKYQLDFKSV